MEIVGFFAAALIGLSLGLIGGGGSILTVPVLVYLFHVDPVLATSYSLFIVGTTSLAGAVKNYYLGQVHTRTVLTFGISSLVTVLLVRRFLLPLIPAQINIAGISISKACLFMVLFALLMIYASVLLINDKKTAANRNREMHVNMLIFYGAAIGLVTGLLGEGGGFLLIPALVMILKLPVKTAIGTSLSIIAISSLAGFAGDLAGNDFDWKLLISITLLAVFGIISGNLLSARISGESLKKGFGFFVLSMGIYILAHELFTTH